MRCLKTDIKTLTLTLTGEFHTSVNPCRHNKCFTIVTQFLTPLLKSRNACE